MLLLHHPPHCLDQKAPLLTPAPTHAPHLSFRSLRSVLLPKDSNYTNDTEFIHVSVSVSFIQRAHIRRPTQPEARRERTGVTCPCDGESEMSWDAI